MATSPSPPCPARPATRRCSAVGPCGTIGDSTLVAPLGVCVVRIESMGVVPMSGGAHPEDRRKHAPFQPAGRSGEARRSLAREGASVKPDELEQVLILLL